MKYVSGKKAEYLVYEIWENSLADIYWQLPSVKLLFVKKNLSNLSLIIPLSTKE